MSFSDPVWESTLCGCVGYRTPITDKLRFYPIFCPLSCCCPCIILGRIKSMVDKEKETCCGMGCQGLLCCCLSAVCLCPFQMGLSASLRSDVARDFRVENGGTCCDTCKGCCCVPCSIFQVYVSLEYWLGKIDLSTLDATTASGPGAHPARMNTATEIVLARLGDTHTFDENDIAAVTGTPAVSTAERVASTRSPPKAQPDMKGNYSSTGNGESISSRQQASSNGGYERNSTSKSTRHQNEVRKSKHTGSERTSSTSSNRCSSVSSKTSSIRVTIPAGHFGGSKFEVDGPDGDVILVTVPQGGKPGMQMDVPI